MIGSTSETPGFAWPRRVRVRRAWPRRGVSIGLIGADGAGKSTVAEAVRAADPANVVCLYMGLYQKGTRAVRLSGLKLATLVCMRAWMWVVGQAQQARGKLVIFDRCAADALVDPPTPLGRAGRARRWVLVHTCPRPRLLVLLDAPGTVLAARTGAPDPAASEEQRQRYLALRKRLPELFVLDATRGVVDLSEHIHALARLRRPERRCLPPGIREHSAFLRIRGKAASFAGGAVLALQLSSVYGGKLWASMRRRASNVRGRMTRRWA